MSRGEGSSRGASAGGSGGRADAAAGRLLAVDRILVVYLVATAVLAAASLEPGALALAVGHAAAAAAILKGGPRLDESAAAAGGLVRFGRLFYPVLLTPLFYHEVSYLGQLHAQVYFDSAVQGWEDTLFGVQLSVAMSRWLPWGWLSELLHLGYVSYYALVPGAALAVYLRGDPRDLHRIAVTVAMAFFGCYLIFAVFPVVGPRYLFPPPEGAAAAGPVHHLTHWILEAGSSKGTAFPSSHVAAAVGAWLGARRAAPGWFAWSAPFVWLLVVGTVYGGFHYGVDALAGLAAAFAAWLATPAVCRIWREPEEGPGNPWRGQGIQRHG